MNIMRKPFVEKIVVNIGVGESGDKLMKAEKILQMVTKHKSVRTISKTINREFGIRKGQQIGCKVTLRGEWAEKFLKDVLWIKDNKILDYSFDDSGNVSLGIPDYTDFPGMKYDPSIGIFGMNVCVTIKRPGSRVSTRKRCARKLPKKQRISPEEAMEFMKEKFSAEVV
ncbi:MAG: 50S ribosomal protein L5 [Thermoplasmata archaeon]